MASKVEYLDPSKLSLKRLDEMKKQFAGEVGTILRNLCVQAERKDTDAIIDRVGDDLEQLFTIGQEFGYREGVKNRDKSTGKLPKQSVR